MPVPDEIYPQALAQQEQTLIESRRRDLGLESSSLQAGVALSGGGIRSATFSLGLFQAMARHDVLKQVDYLSTVSGGGYFGSFLGKLFNAVGSTTLPPKQAAAAVAEILKTPDSEPVAWLREHGRYMAPRGGGDYLLAAAVFLRNWVGVQFVIAITLLMVFLIANAIRAGMWQTAFWTWAELLAASLSLPHLWASPYFLLPVCCFGLLLAPLAWAYWLTQSRQAPRGERWYSRLMALVNFPLVATLLLILLAVVNLDLFGMFQGIFYFMKMPGKDGSPVAWWFLVYAGMVSTALWLGHTWWAAIQEQDAQQRRQRPVATLLNRPRKVETIVRNRLSTWLMLGLGGFIALLVFALVDSLGQTLYALWDSAKSYAPHLGLGAGALVALARYLTPILSKAADDQRKLIRVPSQVIFVILGAALALLVMVGWNALSHYVLWAGGTPHGDPGGVIMRHYAAPTAAALSPPQNLSVAGQEFSSGDRIVRDAPAFELTVYWAVAAVILCWLTGRTLTFLNLSSIHQFYEAHLRRAYLGAASPTRTGLPSNAPEIKRNRDVTSETGCDDLSWQKYRPELAGGPIHLINVTVNETVAAKSNLVQRDRKGLSLAVGPCGVSVGRWDHALWKDEANDSIRQDGTRRIEPLPYGGDDVPIFWSRNPDGVRIEVPTLSKWVAVSGAAFTTGLGSQTNLGLSLLLGLSNMRLGYWWDSGMKPNERLYEGTGVTPRSWLSLLPEKVFSTQIYLGDELSARFHGPQRQRWYLSDGGHFENSGAYELIRRRVPFIIMSDNGRDENYTFIDLAGFARKARIDFNAEVKFLEPAELQNLLDAELRKVIGTPAELQRQVATGKPQRPEDSLAGKAYSKRHATLAWVHYDGSEKPGSLLLIIKPTLTGDEPIDLLEYHSSHADFPQESTLDQFFDEAQWESYRKLGDYIGDKLFGRSPTPGYWGPQTMRQPTQ